VADMHRKEINRRRKKQVTQNKSKIQQSGKLNKNKNVL
jgi:hypothetical protein